MRTEVLLLLALVAAPAVHAEPVLELDVGGQVVSVGDRMTVQILARSDDDLMWGQPEVAVEGGAWAVVDGPRALSGTSPPVWEVVLAPLEVGEVELPPISVSVRPADGEPVVVTAEPDSVTVASVLSEENPEAAPLRGPLGVSGWPWEWLPPAVAAALPVVVVGLLLWRRRRRAVLAAAPTLLPPLEELEKALAGLAERVGRDPAEGVCDRLAWTVRQYLERRTGEPALEMTSHELRLTARRCAWPDAVRRDVQRTMAVADGVRFGRRVVVESELRSAIDTASAGARALEEHLRPAPGEGEGPVGGAP